MEMPNKIYTDKIYQGTNSPQPSEVCLRNTEQIFENQYTSSFIKIKEENQMILSIYL